MAGMLFQAHSCRERVWADPDMGAILTIKGLVRGGIYFGHPALHPSGQLKLFKIDPVNFVLVTSCCCRQEFTRALTHNIATK